MASPYNFVSLMRTTAFVLMADGSIGAFDDRNGGSLMEVNDDCYIFSFVSVEANTRPILEHLLRISAYNWVLTFDIPERFMKKTMTSISSGVFGKSQRTEIISVMHTRMLQYKDFPTPFEYKKACERLVRKYPALVDKSGSRYVSLMPLRILFYTMAALYTM